MSTLAHTNRYKADEQNLEKKNGYVDKKYLMLVFLMITTFLIQKLVKLRRK